MTILPDGSALFTASFPLPKDHWLYADSSAFFTASFPLPKDHWLYADSCAEWDEVRDTSADTPLPFIDNSLRDKVIEAARYAIRGATMNGKVSDFDPDAMVLNMAYAMCGPSGNACYIEEN